MGSMVGHSTGENPLESDISSLSQRSECEAFGASIASLKTNENLPCICSTRHSAHESPSQFREQLVLSGHELGEVVANSTDNQKLNILVRSWTCSLLLALDDNSVG